jgi:hypothetical protein
MQRRDPQVPFRILRGLLIMNSTTDRLLKRQPLAALALVFGGVLGLVAACGSDGGNAKPSGPPVINTGGGGSGGSAGVPDDDAGESSGGNPQGGRAQGGGSNGGGPSDDDGGEGGAAGAPPLDPRCPATGPTTDLGFLNQETTSQKSVFDDTKRLGPHPTLPPLP